MARMRPSARKSRPTNARSTSSFERYGIARDSAVLTRLRAITSAKRRRYGSAYARSLRRSPPRLAGDDIQSRGRIRVERDRAQVLVRRGFVKVDRIPGA